MVRWGVSAQRRMSHLHLPQASGLAMFRFFFISSLLKLEVEDRKRCRDSSGAGIQEMEERAFGTLEPLELSVVWCGVVWCGVVWCMTLLESSRVALNSLRLFQDSLVTRAATL